MYCLVAAGASGAVPAEFCRPRQSRDRIVLDGPANVRVRNKERDRETKKRHKKSQRERRAETPPKRSVLTTVRSSGLASPIKPGFWTDVTAGLHRFFSGRKFPHWRHMIFADMPRDGERKGEKNFRPVCGVVPNEPGGELAGAEWVAMPSDRIVSQH